MITYFAMGITGNIFNWIIFLRQLHHRTACPIYFFVHAIVATVFLTWSVSPRIYALDNFDPENQSLFYCKIRLYGSHVTGLFMRLIVVFACIDRYFITRTDDRARSWRSANRAIKLVVIASIFCPIVGSHLPIFMDIHNGVCILPGFYRFFYGIYQCIMIAVIPSILMSIFGYMAVRNLHRIRATQRHFRRRDTELMRMVIAEVLIHITTAIPFSANLLYNAATFTVTNKTALQLEINSFFDTIAQVMINTAGFTPFYLFLMSSSTFRREFIAIFIDGWHRLKRPQQHTQVVPYV